MSDDLFSRLINQMAYGTVTKGELPGDIEDYSVTLVRQYFKNLPPALKLKFTHKKNLSSNNYNPELDFTVRIDQVREPSNPIILVKYAEDGAAVTARATNKIKKKMMLSVEKESRDRNEILDKEEEESDSDIPRGKPLIYYLKQADDPRDARDFAEEGKAKKRVKADDSD